MSYLRGNWLSMVDDRHRLTDTVSVAERTPEGAVATRKVTEKPKAPEPMPDLQEIVLADTSEYEALCGELGYEPHAIADLRSQRVANDVGRILQSKRIPRYDNKEVQTYMAAITPRNMVWEWVPFGHSGLSIHGGYATGYERSSDSFDDYGRLVFPSDLPSNLPRSYSKLVPIHILRRTKVVRDLFADDDPKFYVTDYAVPCPDPFIKVIVRGHSVIFGVWDEPGFGDLKTEV